MACGKNIIILRDAWRDFRLPMLALATIARKSFNGKFTAKIDFPIGYCMLPLLMYTLKVKRLSIHYFDKYLDHTLVKFEQNCIVRTIKKFCAF